MITDHGLVGVGKTRHRPPERRVNFIQIRDKESAARDLYLCTLGGVSLRRPELRIIVNSRLDIALATGAHGVHLPAGSPAPSRLRPICPDGFLIGVSCHTITEVAQAHRDGADYCLFGPVFSPFSKREHCAPHGIEGLRKAIAAAPIHSQRF